MIVNIKMSVQCTHIVEFLVECVPNCTNMSILNLVSYLQTFVHENGFWCHATSAVEMI